MVRNTGRGMALAYAVCLGGLALLAGCGAGSRAVDDGRLHVVATTGQVADMVRAVGGDQVQVTALMGPGIDPHLYKATPRDRRLLNAADLVLYSGLHLEGRLAELLEGLGRQKPVFAVTDAIREETPERLIAAGEGVTAYDPHVWFDVALWADCIPLVRDRLAEADPEHAETYRKNAEAYAAQLQELDDYARSRIAEIPEGQRLLVTAHDAFAYFGRAYGLEVHGLQGISTADEADLGAVNALVDLLVERKVKAVFVESSVPAKNVRALVEGCQARGHTVAIGGELYSDALGEPGTPAASYAGTVRHNVDTIAGALK